MAIRPGISLQIQNPDIGNIFSNALLTAQRASDLRQAPTRNRLLEAQAGQAEAGVEQAETLNKFTNIAFGASEILGDLEAGNFASVSNKLAARRQRLVQEGRPTETTDEAIGLLQSDPEMLLNSVRSTISTAQQQGILKAPGGGLTSGQKERADLIADLSSPDEQVSLSASVALGLSPRATGSAAQTIALGGLSQDIAESEAIISGAKAGATERAKLKESLRFKPKIASAVKIAEKEASVKGEALTDLNRMNAAMPGLVSAVDQLRALSSVATSTLGGRAFDAVVKESGFGSTKGANARAKFIGIINNQVLPLLKPTFGGSFSVQEGESLKATMGDPNSSPEEKMQQLDAFISQKVRDIESKERELGTEPSAGVEAEGFDQGLLEFMTPEERALFDGA